MKKTIPLWLLCAAALLLAGCGKRPDMAEAPEPAPTEEAASAETPTPHPSATPVPTPEPTPATGWQRGEREESYTLFTGVSEGATAFYHYLLWEGSDLIAGCAPEGAEEPMFTLLYTPREPAGTIPAASEENRVIRLATDERMLESGLWGKLLPDFESKYGYRVEVYVGDADAVGDWANSRSADAALLSDSLTASLPRQGFAAITALVSTYYTLL